jgi:hypothetical protein
MEGVGETMEAIDAKEGKEGVCAKIMKGAMSIMLLVSVVSYATGAEMPGGKAPKGVSARPSK